MPLAVDSMGFGHGRCGKGPCGHGPWVTFAQTPAYPFASTAGFDVDAATFEDLTEQRFLRSRDRGLAFTYQFTRIDSATHTAISSWVQACNGAATRFLALDFRTRRPQVVRCAADTWEVARTVGVNREFAIPFRVERDVTYAEVVMADSPVAYWRLGDATGVSTLADATGNARHGVIVQGVTLQQCGALIGDWDRGVRVTSGGGTAGYARVGSVACADAFTCEFWFKHPAPDAVAEHAIVAYGNSGTSWWVKFLNGLITTHQNTAGTQFSVTSQPYADNAWHHFVWARSAAGTPNATIYIDGASANGTLTSSVPTTAVQSIALFSFAGAQGFQGYVDEFALYGSALSAGRVLEHYRAGVRR